jgi:hypothetical protein
MISRAAGFDKVLFHKTYPDLRVWKGEGFVKRGYDLGNL